MAGNGALSGQSRSNLCGVFDHAKELRMYSIPTITIHPFLSHNHQMFCFVRISLSPLSSPSLPMETGLAQVHKERQLDWWQGVKDGSAGSTGPSGAVAAAQRCRGSRAAQR